MIEPVKPHTSMLSNLARTNFLSSFNPAFFCTFTALFVHYHNMLFDRLAMNVLFTYALFALPMLFTGIPVHYLTTRFSCRNVVTFSRFSEFFSATIAFFILLLAPKSSFLLFLPVVLQGIEYAMFRPALKCYAAEMVPRPLLSKASAATEAATFFGIAAGASTAIWLYVIENQFGGPEYFAGLLSAALALYSLALATRLTPDLALKHNIRFSELPRRWLDSLRDQPRYRELVFTGIGESYIFAIMIFVSAMTVQYIFSIQDDQMTSQLTSYFLLPAPVLGCACGCLISGWLSRNNVELGLVPPSVLAMAILSLLTGTLPFYSDVVIESGLLAIFLFFFGIFSGIMLVPVQAYQQYFVKKSLRSAFFSWFYLPFGLGILLAIALSCLLYRYNIQVYTATTFIAVFTLLLAVVTFTFMSQFLLRMLMKLLLGTLYRLRIFHKERLPEEGPALIVANRASFVDIFFISAATTRPIRFMLHESFFRNAFMRPLYRGAGFFEVNPTSPKKLKRLFEETKKALAKGELVCVFPEGEITRNGTMSEFKDGVSSMLPDNMEVPIIPLRIGMTWGSIFSCYLGKFKLRWPNELPHPATVTIGEPLPRMVSSYELRIRLTELAAETELISGPQERPFHAQFAFIAKKFPFRRLIREFTQNGENAPANISLLVSVILLSRKLRAILEEDNTTYVGIMLPNSIQAVLAFFAVLFADRTPAVLNYTSSRDSFEQAVKKTGIKKILTSREFVDSLKMEVRENMVFMEDILPATEKSFARLFWSIPAFLFTAEELMKLVSPVTWKDVNRTAVILFSSGSTGTPKGIMLSHHNITGDATAVINSIGWNKNDRILGNLPIFHSFGLNVCLWLPVISGTETILVPGPLETGIIGKAMLERKPTVLMATPAFLLTYMRRCPKEAFSSLRLVVTGAEKLRDDIADRFFNLTGLAIAEGYGCTELSPIVSINLANSLMELGTTVAKRGSIGPPVPGVCIKIVDPETFELLPANTDGLLIVKGPVVMQGYLGDPEKTAEVLKDNWYITGDIARMDNNGFITLTGRISRFSKIAGEMVPHELVERELNNILLLDERLLAVCGAPDSKRGEKLLVFYTDRERIIPGELIQQLRERGIPNLWIPKEENFVYIESLPMLGSGKLDLSTLAKLAKKLGDEENQ
ncbi:MAG: MFS transporter [Lentisphaeria bacterium]|nr:MFS transporter [Lentisphaeria bacterium]